MKPPTTWPQIAGYRFETLHTGVLQYVLELGTSASLAVASRLLGEAVTEVWEVRRERRLPGSKNTADLVFGAKLASGPVSVAVETKVDSMPTLEQLRKTTPEPEQRGVYFAVGLSAYAIAEHAVVGIGTGAQWTMIDVARWIDALTPLNSDVLIAPYIDELRRESTAHATFERYAASGHDAEDAELRGRGLWASQVIWISCVRDLAKWDGPYWLQQLSSGSVLYLEIPGWRRSERGVHAYLDLMCAADGSRWLALKCSAELASRRHELSATLRLAAEGHAGWKSARRAKATARSSTISQLGLNGVSAVDAAAALRVAVAEFDAVVNSALDSA